MHKRDEEQRSTEMLRKEKMEEGEQGSERKGKRERVNARAKVREGRDRERVRE